MRILPMLAIASFGLEAQASTIIFVTNSTTGDASYVTFLEGLNYTVDVRTDLGTLDSTKIAELNSADLVIFSRNTSSNDFNSGTEPTQWNGITTPLLLHNPFLVRTSHWNWVGNSTSPTNQTVSSFDVTAAGLTHPIFDGVTGNLFTTSTSVGFNPATTAGNGQMLATAPAPGEQIAIAEWGAGIPFYEGSNQTPAATRIFFSLGPASGSNLNYFDSLSADGRQALQNAIAYSIPEPSAAALLLLAGFTCAWRRRRVA